MKTLTDYLRAVVERGGSDLHLAAGSPPLMRCHGELVRLSDRTLGSHDTEAVLFRFLTPEQRESLGRGRNIDIAHQIELDGAPYRFRGTIYHQKRGLDGVFRVVPPWVPTLQQLNLPPQIEDLTRHRQGLVIVAGPAGSGKTTTLAALIHHINEEQPRHIITIEDPIEYVHHPRCSLVHQRQVGPHTRSFSRALRAALREDPDVVLVAELRDLETVHSALLASETGQLVLAAVTNASVVRTIDRLLDGFPVRQQPQVRSMLAESLRGIVVQQLLPRGDGQGRIPAVELLLGCAPVANALREGKTSQLPSIMQTHRHLGMRTMSEAIRELVQEGWITQETAADLLVEGRVLPTRDAGSRRR